MRQYWVLKDDSGDNFGPVILSEIIPDFPEFPAITYNLFSEFFEHGKDFQQLEIPAEKLRERLPLVKQIIIDHYQIVAQEFLDQLEALVSACEEAEQATGNPTLVNEREYDGHDLLLRLHERKSIIVKSER